MPKMTKFTAEFKYETALLVVEQGYSCVEAAIAAGVSESAVQRWSAQLRAERRGLTPKNQALTDEQCRIQQLEKRIRELEMEKAILKKASALLMLDEFKNIR